MSKATLVKSIEKAVKKVDGEDEKVIYRYLPDEKGYSIHHFAAKKIKKHNPKKFQELLEEFIINVDSPKALPPKPRAPRNSRTPNTSDSNIALPKSLMNQVINMARETGNKELLSQLIAKQPLKSIQRDFIKMIKNEGIDEELWDSYKEAIRQKQAI